MGERCSGRPPVWRGAACIPFAWECEACGAVLVRECADLRDEADSDSSVELVAVCRLKCSWTQCTQPVGCDGRLWSEFWHCDAWLANAEWLGLPYHDADDPNPCGEVG